MWVRLDKSEKMFGSIYYVLSYFLLPYLLSFLGSLLSIPPWCCQMALFALNFLFTLLIFHRFLLANGKAAIASIGKLLCCSALGLVFYYTANLAVSYLIFAVRPEYINLNDAGIVSLAEKGGNWIAAGSVILVPLAEELLFRGMLFTGVRQKHPIGAWFLSAAAFSAVHILGYIGSYDFVSFLLAFVQYLPAGFCLAYAYAASGTILAPVMMHTVINLVGVLILL